MSDKQKLDTQGRHVVICPFCNYFLADCFPAEDVKQFCSKCKKIFHVFIVTCYSTLGFCDENNKEHELKEVYEHNGTRYFHCIDCSYSVTTYKEHRNDTTQA